MISGYDTRFVALHVYLISALDLMWGHRKQDQALPPGQVVRSVPRGRSE